jgi:uncharacterized protein
MTEFTPLSGLLGGVMIGLSAVILMAGPGRIMGASGIFSGLLTTHFNQEFRWRMTFIIAMMVGAAWTGLFAFDSSSIAFIDNRALIGIAGVLVGAGTVLGSGCTSGHGICGLARLSKRSLAATIIFMVSAMLTVFITRHITGI